jgi:hypothetical protein
MKRITVAATVCAVLGAAPVAHAFCGFYVAGGDQQMFNDATQVVLMRSGTRTVLSMQNNYKGPPQDFAMVIPVPVVLHEGDVKTLPKEVFAHVEKMGAPRLVEYWEQDPCHVEPPRDERLVYSAAPSGSIRRSASGGADLGVTVEAQFVVGEYQIQILSAKEATGLETWLRQQKYNIPPGVEPLLRPYVEGGSKFFVAKVDPQKVKFEGGRAALSPLRFHYDTEQFSLPIRLGLANSSGKQDLIVNILAPHQRYEVSNYKNVTIPTNIDVRDSVKDKFGAFYAALFDATIEKNPGAVVTEYAWQATSCDPCPGPVIGYHELMTLGGDVLQDSPIQQAPPMTPQGGRGPQGGGMRRPMPRGFGIDFVLTRLHARYGKDITNDLELKAAEPIVGGREFVQTAGKLEEGSRPASVNNFQGRYAIRHEWTGPIACANPVRHRWGGPPAQVTQQPGFQYTATKPALELAFAPRGTIDLPQSVGRDVPEIDLKMAAATIGSPNAPAAAVTTTPAPPTEKKKAGCGCQSSDPAGLAIGLGTVLLALCRPRRRGARCEAKRYS